MKHPWSSTASPFHPALARGLLRGWFYGVSVGYRREVLAVITTGRKAQAGYSSALHSTYLVHMVIGKVGWVDQQMDEWPGVSGGVKTILIYWDG